MGHRSRAVLTLLAIGITGFMLGAIANIVYSKAFPVLIEVFPQIFSSEWAAWGIVGAILAVVCCLIYAYLL